MLKQECIPVGCVPAAHRPYAGVCFPGGVSDLGGVCLVWEGVCMVPGGGFCLVLGGVVVSDLGGCLPGPGGVSAWSRGGVGIPACIETEPPPHEQNDKQV